MSTRARARPSLWRRYWAALTGTRPRPVLPVTGKTDTLTVTPAPHAPR